MAGSKLVCHCSFIENEFVPMVTDIPPSNRIKVLMQLDTQDMNDVQGIESRIMCIIGLGHKERSW